MARTDNYWTPADRANALENLAAMVETIRQMPVQTPCTLCQFFSAGMCTKWGAMVPDAAREIGCDKWEQGVPF